ncbi:hypothetical protein Q7C_1495 [Methylophaga frappieri]|uniref:Uncharacterized protein n=2 Tax=Methylophaga frappieri (strain ATCC BAA-2434 / DSM 25690 / JAM7) TaxID=754477 RepID=I1YIA1_METFJ|nr:hypothetical protein Q7C_1495 [Methylophaga frappieri]
MYLEKRPTSVSVIAWAWIVIGFLMLISATLGLFAHLVTSGYFSESDWQFTTYLYPTIALTQIAVAIMGLVAGIFFLKMRPWARFTLEILTWLSILLLAGFFFFVMMKILNMGSVDASHAPQIVSIFMTFAMILMYGLPLFFVLRRLRSPKVRLAVNAQANAAVEPAQDNPA